jgi:uncharacterized surface protein with fasciclin (FAS1) repeats
MGCRSRAWRRIAAPELPAAFPGNPAAQLMNRRSAVFLSVLFHHKARELIMSKISKLWVVFGTAVLAVISAAWAAEKVVPSTSGKQDNSNEDKRAMNIVETAVNAGSFRTLAAALEAAGLVDTLKGQGPFTVFAPTDEAFAKLPSGTVESLLKPENKDQLKAILTYHVVPGSVKAADVVKLKTAKTVLGQSLAIDTTDGVKVNGAKVIKADIVCSNGVIHVIDAVLLPKQ